MRFAVRVEVSLRPGIADPEAATIERALPALGFGGISEVATGKVIGFEIEADDATEARARAEAVCDRFLTNPVIEEASITVGEAPAADDPGAPGAAA